MCLHAKVQFNFKGIVWRKVDKENKEETLPPPPKTPKTTTTQQPKQ